MKIKVADMHDLVIPPVEGHEYRRRGCKIRYSSGLARDAEGSVVVGVRRDRIEKALKHRGYRFPTAAELKTLVERDSHHPTLDDMFSRGNPKKCLMEQTGTILHSINGTARSENGRRYWLYGVLEGDVEVCRVWVPQTGFVREWHPCGVPSETADSHRNEAEAHFLFHHDMGRVGIVYGMTKNGGSGRNCEQNNCYTVYACINPDHEDRTIGFRIVRGDTPEYSRCNY